MEKVDTKVMYNTKRRCQMERVPNGKYTKEFRVESVKLVTEGGLSVVEAGRRLSLPPSTLNTWVKHYKAGKLREIGKTQKPLTEVELELSKVKRELAEVKMERDILKKAAAYFAKESLPGTR
jgi:transposase